MDDNSTCIRVSLHLLFNRVCDGNRIDMKEGVCHDQRRVCCQFVCHTVMYHAVVKIVRE